jgi:putative addiction module component (TIGR02574 family)
VPTNIETLSASEKIFLAQELWESVHHFANNVPVSQPQWAILRARLKALDADKNPGDSWENVKRRIRCTTQS